jgi:phage terminase large subunit
VSKQIDVRVPEKLLKLIVTPKPLKIAVGGRGAGKTIAFSDCWLKYCDDGERLICAREFQNSIEESVHSSLTRRINHHGIDSLEAGAKAITGNNGGKIVYLGLARNIGSVKSFDGANRVWIEEGQYISQGSIDVLFPTIREEGSEIWVSMNRGSSKDPISKSFLKIAEHDLARTGSYEDDYMMIVDINYNDNPWFPEKLSVQRLRDKEQMDDARYAHIWEGAYSDTVENAIIPPEWFDACIDAHEKLGFDPLGVEVVAHDPSDLGSDDKALCYRHGSVIKDIQYKEDGDVNEGCDWALGYAVKVKSDAFVWDVDGMGAGLKRQVSEALTGKKISAYEFSGAMAADNPDRIYDPIDDAFYGSKPKTNRETFFNRRAQKYWELRDRMYKTFCAVVRNKYFPPDELISFSSDIKCLDLARAEVCRIPLKDNNAGRIQILSKPEMKKLGIDSPNISDVIMMSISIKSVERKKWAQPIKPPKRSIA